MNTFSLFSGFQILEDCEFVPGSLQPFEGIHFVN